jgi:hypothetical protein
MVRLRFNWGQESVNYCILDFHSRVFLLAPYPLCLTYFVLSVWKRATETKFNLPLPVQTAVHGCLTEIVCHHGEMVTQDIFTQKEANTNDRISTVEWLSAIPRKCHWQKSNSPTRWSTIRTAARQWAHMLSSSPRWVTWHQLTYSYILTSSNSQTNQ